MEGQGNDKFTFTWIIGNFSMCRLPKGEFICSPKFALNSLPGIEWYISLYPQGDTVENYIALSLWRGDDVSEDCSIKYNIQGLDCNEKLIFSLDEQMKVVVVPSKCRQVHNRVFERNSLFPSLMNDILIIKCALKPVCATNESEFLNQLSYKNGLFTDVVLRAGDEVFKVHKAILWARWPKLAEKLDAEATCEEILDIESDVLEAMIEYVYTGKLDCSKPDLLVKLYAAAAKYELLNVQCMAVVGQKWRTRINMEEISFEWKIENFSSLPINTVLNSHVFSVDILKSCRWNLKLRICENTKNKRIHIRGNTFDVSLCKICDCESKPIFVKSKISFDVSNFSENEYFFRANESWKCANFSRSNTSRVLSTDTLLLQLAFAGSNTSRGFWGEMQHASSEDTLQLKCEFKFSDCDYFSEIMKSSCAFVSSINCQYFSHDFRNLYKSGRFSDISIIVDSKTFSAHKSILCARSSVFSRMFETEMTESKENRVEISDIDPDIMDEMLVYMYSSYLEKPLEETAEKLYAAADKYDISALKKKCSSFLKSNLATKNVCKVLQLAGMHSDDDLYKGILEFASAHAEDVFSTDEWKEIVKDNLVAKLLQNVVCKK